MKQKLRTIEDIVTLRENARRAADAVDTILAAMRGNPKIGPLVAETTKLDADALKTLIGNLKHAAPTLLEFHRVLDDYMRTTTVSFPGADARVGEPS